MAREHFLTGPDADKIREALAELCSRYPNQREAGKAIGLSQQTVSRALKPREPIGDRVARAVTKATGRRDLGVLIAGVDLDPTHTPRMSPKERATQALVLLEGEEHRALVERAAAETRGTTESAHSWFRRILATLETLRDQPGLDGLVASIEADVAVSVAQAAAGTRQPKDARSLKRGKNQRG